jgi:putative transposase
MLRRHERLDFPGSLHFITTVACERGNWFVAGDLCQNILTCFETCRAQYDIHCFGYVLMPDHLHIVLYQVQDEANVPAMLRRFKSLTSTRFRPVDYRAVSLWRSRYDDVPLPGEKALKTRLAYMHENPVRRGLVELPEAYLWSSARDWMDLESGIIHLSKELIG